jgi:hypothetical protein
LFREIHEWNFIYNWDEFGRQGGFQIRHRKKLRHKRIGHKYNCSSLQICQQTIILIPTKEKHNEPSAKIPPNRKTDKLAKTRTNLFEETGRTRSGYFLAGGEKRRLGLEFPGRL